MTSEKNGSVELSPEYPRLLRQDNGMVVLFMAHGVGTVVHVGFTDSCLGLSSINWQMEKFEDFKGTIKLSN